MKRLYPKFRLTGFLILILSIGQLDLAAQSCPTGHIPTSVAYDTTVSTGSGNYATQFTFPKMDPTQGMVSCVRLCITITGVVNMFLENNVTSPAIYNINYTRKDTLSGPGLNSPMTNQINTSYGPYNLDASDGVPFSGADFQTIGPVTVLNSHVICRTITDSVDLVDFYGTDSVVYTYNINAGAGVTGSGDYLFSVSTTGSVNYKLEYCVCPPVALPGNIRDFDVTKLNESKVKLNWTGENDQPNYHYEAEMSRNGVSFEKIGVIPKNLHGELPYSFIYDLPSSGRYFFRIRQVHYDGASYFTNIKYIDAANPTDVKFKVYPNPSNGIVGIKFDNITAGKYLVLINNAQGQSVVRKEIEVAGNTYQQVATLQSGFYWVRLINVNTQVSSVNQLYIK